jgi:hypothetical protein
MQSVATADDLDAWVRRANAGEQFTYCEAPELIRGETSMRVTALEREGLVRPHRARREGGGWTFFVVRTARGCKREASPADKALSEGATDLIFRALKRAANMGQPCPTDADLARGAGLVRRQDAAWRIRRLIDLKLIASEVEYRAGVPFRVVTIAESGKSTLRPSATALGRTPTLSRSGGKAER